jgi:hypothetical protein
MDVQTFVIAADLHRCEAKSKVHAMLSVAKSERDG